MMRHGTAFSRWLAILICAVTNTSIDAQHTESADQYRRHLLVASQAGLLPSSPRRSVANAGDVDGDECEDVLIGFTSSHAAIHSGRTGSLIRLLSPTPGAQRYATAVESIGDATGDGVPDVVLTDNWAVRAELRSGADGSVVYTLNSTRAGFGNDVNRVGDCDADGYADFAIVTSDDLEVVSGRNGTLLFRDPSYVAVRVGDVNADGHDDIAVAGRTPAFQSFVRVVSGADGSELSRVTPAVIVGLAEAGDVNGDGTRDVLVGLSQTGQVEVRSGADLSIIHTLEASRDWVPTFTSPGMSRFGGPMGPAGDVDGDGFDDVLVGTDWNNNTFVWLFSGATGTLLTRYVGTGRLAYLGTNLGHADVDADGRSELVIVEPLVGVHVIEFSGRVVRESTIASPNVGARFGSSVDTIGDIDGDGIDDLVVGSPAALVAGAATGSASVVSGVTGAEIFRLDGIQAHASFGARVRRAGDVNGDGTADVIVGAPGSATMAGAAFVFSGATGAELHRFSGTMSGDGFGTSVAGAGDVNADGFDDVIVGAPGRSTAQVFSGSDGSVLHQKVGGGSGTLLGQRVLGGGDVNRDGFDDFVVSEPAAPGFGRVSVYSGDDGSMLYQIDAYSDPFTDPRAFGRTMDRVDDVDGDGVPEFLIGDPSSRRGTFTSPLVVLYSGATGSLMRVMRSTTFRIDGEVRGVSDLDGDGLSDVMLASASSGDVIGLSGASGAVIFRERDLDAIATASTPAASAGFAMTAIDRNGDGFAEPVLGIALTPVSGVAATGEVRIFDLDLDAPLPGSRAFERVHGAPCPGSSSRLPRTEFTGDAAIGATLDVALRNGPASAAAVLHLGLPRPAISLGSIGLTGCEWHTRPFVAIASITNAVGGATLSLPINASVLPIGGVFTFQWAIRDVGANSLGVSLSDALSIVVR